MFANHKKLKKKSVEVTASREKEEMKVHLDIIVVEKRINDAHRNDEKKSLKKIVNKFQFATFFFLQQTLFTFKLKIDFLAMS
jgi:hypothetical protein